MQMFNQHSHLAEFWMTGSNCFWDSARDGQMDEIDINTG
jgi:hypothetical protein